jgi:hypothetical protein
MRAMGREKRQRTGGEGMGRAKWIRRRCENGNVNESVSLAERRTTGWRVAGHHQA